MEMYQKIEDLESKGYSEIQTDSGTGSRILINPSLGRAVKINQDQAYNHFMDYVQSNRSSNFPVVYKYEKIGKPPYDSNHGFTVIEMGMLEPLDDTDVQEYLAWMRTYWEAKRNNLLPKDDLGILSAVDELVRYAAANGINIDLDKGSNVMKSTNGTYVITDPYN